LHDRLNFARIMLGSRTHSWFTDVMHHLDELRSRIARLAAGSPRLWIEGMTVFSTGRVTEPLGTITEPVLALVAQGAKRSVLGDRIFDYHAGQYLVVTVDLPLTSQITHATPTEPFLAFGLPLQPALIAQLLVEGGSTVARPHDGPGIATSDADDKLLDAVVRLLRLLDEPRDVPVLAPGVRREIHWRLLNASTGACSEPRPGRTQHASKPWRPSRSRCDAPWLDAPAMRVLEFLAPGRIHVRPNAHLPPCG
jgi:hypothetical protein